MDSIQTERRIAVVAAIIVILVGAWGIYYGGKRERTAAIATVSAAASTRGCKLDSDNINRLITQYRDQYDVGWYESGGAVAKNIRKNCATASSS